MKRGFQAEALRTSRTVLHLISLFLFILLFQPEPARACPDGPPQIESLLSQEASRELGRSVSVTISHRKQVGDWLFLSGAPRELNGDPLDYSKTRYAAQAAEGLVDDVWTALARRSHDRWEILAFSVGSTDAPFFDWIDRFGAPPALFSNQK